MYLISQLNEKILAVYIIIARGYWYWVIVLHNYAIGMCMEEIARHDRPVVDIKKDLPPIFLVPYS